jgi:hypothetical protein
VPQGDPQVKQSFAWTHPPFTASNQALGYLLQNKATSQIRCCCDRVFVRTYKSQHRKLQIFLNGPKSTDKTALKEANYIYRQVENQQGRSFSWPSFAFMRILGHAIPTEGQKI